MLLKKEQQFINLFILSIIAVTLVRIGILAMHVWPVNGDETQYYSWAKHLAFGYYSKPPMVAWLISLTTWIFGDGITAMRLASPLTHSMTAIMIFLSARYLFSDRIGFWAGITYLLAPGVTFSASIISTDPPLLMFWSMAFYCFIRAIEQNQIGWWALVGLALGFGMLSKYAALFFPLSALLFFLIDKKTRYLALKPGLYLAVLIALIILIPNIYWNYQHAFVSVMAVKNNADLSGPLFHPMNLLNFLGSQFAVFGPIMFITLFVTLFRKSIWKNRNYKLLLAFIIPVLVVMTSEAFLQRAHGNWAAPIYMAASILVAAVLVNEHKVYWLKAALILHIIVIIGFINIQPIVQAMGLKVHQPTTIVNFGQQGQAIHDLRLKYNNPQIIVDNRMLLTEIMYFAKIPLKSSNEWNPSGQIHDQYDLVTHLSRKTGENFLLLTYRSNPWVITRRFEKVKHLPVIQLKTIDGRQLPLYAFYLTGFKGYG